MKSFRAGWPFAAWLGLAAAGGCAGSSEPNPACGPGDRVMLSVRLAHPQEFNWSPACSAYSIHLFADADGEAIWSQGGGSGGNQLASGVRYEGEPLTRGGEYTVSLLRQVCDIAACDAEEMGRSTFRLPD